MNFLISYGLLRDLHCVFVTVSLGTTAVAGPVSHGKSATARNLESLFSVVFHRGVSKYRASASKQAVELLKVLILLDKGMITFLGIWKCSVQILYLISCKERGLLTSYISVSVSLCPLFPTNNDHTESDLELQEATVRTSQPFAKYLPFVVQSFRSLLCGPWHCPAWINCKPFLL